MSEEDKKITVWKYFAKGEHINNAKCLLCSAVLNINQRLRTVKKRFNDAFEKKPLI